MFLLPFIFVKGGTTESNKLIIVVLNGIWSEKCVSLRKVEWLDHFGR